MLESDVDFLTESTAILFQDQPLLHRSNRLMRVCSTAAAADRTAVVVTPSSTTLTHPAADLLSVDGCAWLVATEDGGFYDGFTGRVMTWDGEGFQGTDKLADDFLVTEASPAPYVHVRAETLHPASLSTRVGQFTEQAFRQLTGSAPAGWGVSEPVSELWDPAALTEYAFGRAPKTTHIVVVGIPPAAGGTPATGVLRIERSPAGVHESLEVLAEAAEPLTEDEKQQWGSAMHRAHARSVVLGQGMGWRRLARPARFTGVTVPAVAVFGPESLQAVGAAGALEAALDLTEATARLVGVAPAQSLAVTYPDREVRGAPHPLEALAGLTLRLAGRVPGS